MYKPFYNDDKERHDAERYINTDNFVVNHDLRLWLKLANVHDCNDMVDLINKRIKDVSNNKNSDVSGWLTQSLYQVRDDYYSIHECLDHDDDPENWRL